MVGVTEREGENYKKEDERYKSKEKNREKIERKIRKEQKRENKKKKVRFPNKKLFSWYLDHRPENDPVCFRCPSILPPVPITATKSRERLHFASFYPHRRWNSF
ncbi:hypothetical protein TNCT_734481 [Trichonephila clavata]|uniref:Uncharacterized protein n=1 Tax=Trichonephila clavata TaxID=2740835 RepID=A0A8X6LKK0_TRICU|nr:hypothetical protein TNCT_734481 [Trichonephila clavata]